MSKRKKRNEVNTADPLAETFEAAVDELESAAELEAEAEAETVSGEKLPRLFPSQVASLFPADKCVAVHERGIYMACTDSNRWIKDGELDKPVGSQSRLRAQIGGFCDELFRRYPEPDADAKKDYRTTLFTTKFRDEVTKEIRLRSVSPDSFDADPMLLGLDRGPGRPSAVVDLKTKAIRDMEPADFITRKCTTMPDWEMATPRFDDFLLSVLSGEVERRDYLLRLLGYGLTGLTSEDVLAFLLGSGGNGKSTLLDVLAHVVGRHYCVTIRTSSLLEKNGASSDDTQKRLMARFYGRRLVLADEANKQMRFDQALLKQLSTTSRLVGAFVYEKEFEFRPSHLLLISLDKPPLLEATRGMRRRLHLIEFRENFEKDVTLLPALQRETPGILAKLIDGCVEWQQSGLNPPTSVLSAGEDLLSDGDVFGRWLNECTEFARGFKTARDIVQNSFDDFRRNEKDNSPMTAMAFTQLFRGYQQYDRQARTSVNGKDVRAIGNIRLKAGKPEKS